MAQRRKVERGEGEFNYMSLKILKAEDRFIRFTIDGITTPVANALRRTLLDDIPKLAIDRVIFHHGQIRDREGNVYDSSLPLFDEIVAHRLSLVPLVTDPKMNFREECVCEGKGCPLCTMSYSINKIGPSVVTSADLQPMGNPELVPSDPDIPIVKLGPKQAILVTGEAVMGRGKTHTKWQVTSGVFYKYHREFVVTKAEFEKWASIKEKCPQSVLSEDSRTIRFTDDNSCKAVRQLLDYPSVKMVEDDTQFVFQFETDGSYKAIEVLEYALKRLPQRLNTLLESLTAPD